MPNWRFLGGLALVLVAGAVAVNLVHRRQVGQQVGAFLRHADSARDAKDPVREAEYLRRYLIARPDDLDARERLGRVLCDSAKGARGGKTVYEGYLVLQEVLRRDPARADLRRYTAELAMRPDVGLYAEARADIEVLLTRRPDDGELLELAARCLVAAQMFAEAEARYTAAVRHRPDLLAAYAARAAVLRLHLNRPEDADAAVAAMLTANPRQFRAHLNVAEYWRVFAKAHQPAAAAAGAVAKAQELPAAATVADATDRALGEARRLGPDELDVLLVAAEVARDRSAALARVGKRDEARVATEEARQLLGRAVALHRTTPAAHLAMAELEADTHGPAAAAAAVRRGLEAVPDSDPLVVALLDYQLRAGDAAAAAETLDRLRGAGLPPAVAEFHQARLQMLAEQYLEAALTLEKVRPDLLREQRLVREADLLLGRCYEQIGENDRRLAAFRRAVPADPDDPLWVPALAGVAEAEAALGLADAALASYRRLKDRAAGAWVQVARLETIRALLTAPEKRDWRASEEAVAAAGQALPDATEFRILRADLLHFRGKAAEARTALDELRAARPKEAAVWVAAAAQDLREGNPKRAAETLAAGEREAGDTPEIRLARARLWAEIKEPDFPARVLGLAAGAEKFGRLRHRRLLLDLAAVATAAGAGDVAGRLWEQVAVVQPKNLAAQLVRFDRALAAGDEQTVTTVLGDIGLIDGEGGPSARLARVLHRIWRAQHRDDKSGLPEALEVLEGLARERAGWGRVALAHALVHDLRGDLDAALGKYQQAVDYGESNPQALRRLMEILHARGRSAEAAQLLERLPAAVASGADVQRLAAEVSLRSEDPRRALEYATRAVPDTSTDPKDHIWKGQVYWAAGDRAKAEAPFRRAVTLRPESPDGWLVLIHYLAATGRRDDGARELADARGKVAPAERTLFLGMAHARLGDPDRAAEAFGQARAERRDDLRTLQAEAEFLFQAGRLDPAREAFQRILDLQSASAEDKDFARRMLAICLAASPDYETSRRALELLGLLDNGALRAPAAAETPDQRRARAVALALQRDRASKLEAVRTLEEIRDKLAPSDQFLLAQLYVATGNKPQVRVVMTDLLRRAEGVPLYVAFYAAWLIREQDVRAAEEWVTKLAAREPEALRTAELKARLAAARKDLPAARSALVPKADGPNAPVEAIARVCEEIGLFDDAERLYTRVADGAKSARPEAALVLARFYGRRGRLADALRVCAEVRSRVPAVVVGEAAVTALYAATDPPAAAMATVAGWLDEAVRAARGPEQAGLVQLLAAVRNLQGDYDAAMALYRQAIAANPRDAVALNNLAFLVSAQEKKHVDALGLLARARQAVGPNPELDDTEALVRLAKGETDAARKLLEGVVAQTPTGSAYFHLAQVESAANRDLEARSAWRQATDAGLRRADLHPLECHAYDQLAARLR
ncbi:tetratricopeptide repeat protein [Urbifossiella limnaea]|uniref:tetratricopeptide repeat protein n=1 Tax=Urbifossiella limnaea TaxID=2528023 RepID=UPI00119E4055|nr:tetratricopeptide repeat protein [Urbifossiella limnaea]